jgi:ATP-binding cassette, subfamily C, bacterial EexD
MENVPYTALAEILSRCRRGMVAAAFLSAMINLLVLVVSIYSLLVFDRVLTGGSLPTLVVLTLIAGIVVALTGALEILRGQILSRCGACRLHQGRA